MQRGQRVVQAPGGAGQRQVRHPPPQLLCMRARRQRQMTLACRPSSGQVKPVAAAPGQRAQLPQRAVGRAHEGLEPLVGREPQRQRQLRPPNGAACLPVHAGGVPLSSPTITIDAAPSSPDPGAGPLYMRLAV